jgi:hypothetical protein
LAQIRPASIKNEKKQTKNMKNNLFFAHIVL